VLPNAWDPGSARMFEDAGFPAIATTSAGIAFSLGRPDHGFVPSESRVSRTRMLESVKSIVDAVSIPVSADLENGYGSAPNEVAQTIADAIALGAAGANIEDYTGNASLYESELAVERIRAAHEAIGANRSRFVLVARTDCFLVGQEDPLGASIERGNAFRAAGADCVFVPGVTDEHTIRVLTKEIDAPLNVVTGLTGDPMSLAEFAALGVRRVTIGGSLARAMYERIRQAAAEMLERGTFTFGSNQIPQSELNDIFTGRG
jgi:2-methylisocitrate lyase-like PEP mutase family enzyme